jgi:hypothetical protein
MSLRMSERNEDPRRLAAVIQVLKDSAKGYSTSKPKRIMNFIIHVKVESTTYAEAVKETRKAKAAAKECLRGKNFEVVG